MQKVLVLLYLTTIAWHLNLFPPTLVQQLCSCVLGYLFEMDMIKIILDIK